MISTNIVTAVDIGTTKVYTLIAEIVIEENQENIEIIGIGAVPCTGLKKGVVINIDETVRAIKESVSQAEKMANVSVDSAYISISGAHISSQNANGILAISGIDKEITEIDIEKVTENAKASTITANREIIHTMVRKFKVDNQDNIINPIGMVGHRLEVDVHIVTGQISAIQNIIKCVKMAGYNVIDIVFQLIASSKSVITEDEKELGVVVVDIGGGTTDIGMYHRGSICYSRVEPIGGDHITNDIAIGLSTPLVEAENIKKTYGCSFVVDDEEVSIKNAGNTENSSIPKSKLVEIISYRVQEIFQIIKNDIIASNYANKMSAGVVLTGGTSKLKNILEVAQEILEIPVRLGKPGNILDIPKSINEPEFSTVLGLLYYGIEDRLNDNYAYDDETFFEKMIISIKKWFSELLD